MTVDYILRSDIVNPQTEIELVISDPKIGNPFVKGTITDEEIKEYLDYRVTMMQYFDMINVLYLRIDNNKTANVPQPEMIPKSECLNILYDIGDIVWAYDIPHPSCPEYREHHEAMQILMNHIQTRIKDIKNMNERGEEKK